MAESIQTTSDIRWDILEEHLDEAAFLRQMWEQSLRSPDYALWEIAEGPEARMLAHLDGLVIGGKRVAKKLLLPALKSDEPGKAFAAAFALLASEDGDFLGEVLLALEKSEADARSALRRALEVAPVGKLAERLTAAAAQPGALQGELLLVLAYRRIDTGLRLDALASSQDTSLRARSLRLASFLPGRLSAAILEQAFSATEPEVRAAALETGCILGAKGAFSAAQSIVKDGGPGFATAALILGLSGEEGTVAALAPTLNDSERQRASIFALGFSGRLSAVDLLLQLLEEDKVAPLAAEAISFITGLAIAKQFAGPPKRWDPDAKDEPDEEEDVGPEASLPRPDPATIREWWKREGQRLDRGIRHLRGKPWSTETILRELELGPAIRRAGLALDVAVRSSAAHQLMVDALSQRQREELVAAAGARLQQSAYSTLRTSPVPAPTASPQPRKA
jgi:uncharacterized protein (TIGR02270 family)